MKSVGVMPWEFKAKPSLTIVLVQGQWSVARYPQVADRNVTHELVVGRVYDGHAAEFVLQALA
jgi:hypothetical protein